MIVFAPWDTCNQIPKKQATQRTDGGGAWSAGFPCLTVLSLKYFVYQIPKIPSSSSNSFHPRLSLAPLIPFGRLGSLENYGGMEAKENKNNTHIPVPRTPGIQVSLLFLYIYNIYIICDCIRSTKRVGILKEGGGYG